MDLPSVAQETERPCLSTGHLPAPEVVRKYLTDACQHLQIRYQPVGRRRSPFPACIPLTIEK